MNYTDKRLTAGPEAATRWVGWIRRGSAGVWESVCNAGSYEEAMQKLIAHPARGCDRLVTRQGEHPSTPRRLTRKGPQ